MYRACSALTAPPCGCRPPPRWYPRACSEARGFAGFYNLALMCFAYYMATTMWMNYSRHGNIFGTQGANTAALFIQANGPIHTDAHTACKPSLTIAAFACATTITQSPELALAVVCLYAWSFTAFFLQKLIVWGVVGGVMEHVLQHSIQVLLSPFLLAFPESSA